MQAQIKRCKAIVSGILLSAGEARGEAPAKTTLQAFLDELVEEWRATPAADLASNTRTGSNGTSRSCRIRRCSR
jgi:two-component system sensor histidine kinase RegB